MDDWDTHWLKEFLSLFYAASKPCHMVRISQNEVKQAEIINAIKDIH